MIANGIASVLRSLVGDYVEGIDGEHFKVGKMLRKGEVVLKNLRIKPTALEALPESFLRKRTPFDLFC